MEKKKQLNNITIDYEGLRLPDSRTQELQVIADLIARENSDKIGFARGIIRQEMFSDPELKRAWNCIIESANKGKDIDLTIISTKVNPQTACEIVTIQSGFSKTVEDHCVALIEMATRRLVFSKCYDMMTATNNPGIDLDELIAMPGSLRDELNNTIQANTATESVTDILNEFADDLVNRQQGKSKRVPTGFSLLDSTILGGWTQGNLIILAARPSVGKSALMLQMAVTAARAGFSATVYSLEMGGGELGQRLVLSTGMIRQSAFMNDTVVKNFDWEPLERANKCFDNLPLQFNTRLRTMDEICNDIVLQHQRGRCSIAFIDHLHTIGGADKQMTSTQVITDRTRRFKTLAMDNNIPVVLLCQLNRLSEAETRAPQLRDLRDSGSIEQDADIVLMLSRENNDLSNSNLDLWIRKNRNGKAGGCILLQGDDSRGFTYFTQREPEPNSKKNDNNTLPL